MQADRQTSMSSAPSSIEVKFIAVLPFDNESPDKGDDYLGGQMAEELSSTLARIPELRVLGRDSAAALKSAKDRSAAAQQLKVSAFLAGTVRKSGNQLRLTAQLINAADGSLLWSDVYDREMKDIFGIQTDIAEKLAEKLKLNLTDTIQASLARKATKDFEAYRCYLEGRDWLNRESVVKASASFQEASRLDTNFALAYAGLSDVYVHANASRAFRLSPQETISNALVLAEKAVRLDDSSAEAHIALANAKKRLYDWKGAEKEIKRAIQLNPNYARLQVSYSSLLRVLGRFDEAIAASQLAKTLDPWSVQTRRSLGWTFFEARQHKPAQKEFEELVKFDENSRQGWEGLGSCFEVMGRHDDAVAAWEKALPLWGMAPDKIAELTQAYKSAGMRGVQQKELEQMRDQANSGEYVDSFWIAVSYAELGESDQAFAWLDRAYEDRHPWMPLVAVQYRLRSLYSDPRFAALLKRMGLVMPVWKKGTADELR